jgi:hypothetical protein
MAHCGFEATAVEDMLAHPVKALLTSIKGPKTSGDMVPAPAPHYEIDNKVSSISAIPVRTEVVDS